MNIKGEISAFNVVIGILIVVGIFSGMFLFFQDNMADADVSVDSKYINLQRNLSESQEEIDDKTEEVRTALEEIQEAESGVGTLYYGIKGFGKSLKLLVTLVTTAIGVVTDVLFPIDFIPTWVRALVLTGIAVIIVFALLKAIKGGSTNV